MPNEGDIRTVTGFTFGLPVKVSSEKTVWFGRYKRKEIYTVEMTPTGYYISGWRLYEPGKRKKKTPKGYTRARG